MALIVFSLGGLTTQIIISFKDYGWLHDSLAESSPKRILNMGIDIKKGLDAAGDEIKEMRKDIKRITNSDKND